MKELVIKSRGPNPAAALTESGKLIAYFPLVKQVDIAPEAVFIGRAGRVLKNLEALFVDLPGGASGYLAQHQAHALGAQAHRQPGKGRFFCLVHTV